MARAVSSKRQAKVPKKWRDLFALIPGYDPIATAGDAWFDSEAAQLAADFFPECQKHIEGDLAGKPFALEPWQQAFVGCLFGWKRIDSQGRTVRRYRESFLCLPRKNGKTPQAAGIANYVLFCEQEKGQQDICAAGERDQATLLFRHAVGMIRQEPELDSRCQIYGERGTNQTRSIVVPETNSYLKVISSEAKTKHGGNPHVAIIDELHSQPNRDLVDVIRTSMASLNRKQPLLIFITTADFDQESICNEIHDYARNVRDGVVDNAAFLPMIYEAVEGENWTDPKLWERVNPNLDVSVSREYLEAECARAQETPTYENTFKRLHLNMKTQQDVRWIRLEDWDACEGAVVPEDLAGQPCYAGLDLSSTTDLSAFVLYFPDTHVLLPFFWIPGDNAEKRERRDKVPYLTWARQGLLEMSPGNVIDYDRIRAKINELNESYNIKEIAIDRWAATQITTQLDGDGFTVVPFGQGYASMNAPAQEFERLILGGEIRHGGNPIMRWMVSHVSAEMNAAGFIKPSKDKSSERVDGIFGAVMAIGQAIVRKEKRSVYEDRGVVMV